jgi:hypothetical protein
MAGGGGTEVNAVNDNSDPGEDERVPIFGSWPRIYAAVIVCAVLSMALIGLFSTWNY